MEPRDLLFYITPDTIRMTHRGKKGEREAWTLRIAEIEAVECQAKRGGLVFITDTATRIVPAILSLDAAEWLRNYILAAIATQPADN